MLLFTTRLHYIDSCARDRFSENLVFGFTDSECGRYYINDEHRRILSEDPVWE